jgi:hypothetical protein
VEGEVRLKLYKGNTIVTGRRSPHSLYSMKHVTFEDDQGAYDQVDAQGFIKLNALRLRLGAMAGRRGGACSHAGHVAARGGARAWRPRRAAIPLRSHHAGREELRYVLLGLDVLSIAWIVTASFYGPIPAVLAVDALLGVLLLAEFAMRVAASGRPWHAATRPLNIADLLAILSLLLAPLLHGALGFLRVLRTLRLLHSVRLISSLRSDLPFFRRNEEATLAAAQLGVFLFIMSGLVFESQHRTNPGIANYADALYFTVTA